MAIYAYECSCGNKRDEIRRVAERNDPVVCSCGKNMERVIVASYVSPDMAPYYDDNLETYVTSRQHRKEVMRQRGVSEIYGKHWYTGKSAKGR